LTDHEEIIQAGYARLKKTFDHKIPIWRGGTNQWDNFAHACLDCNHNKGSLTADEFLYYRNDPAMLKRLHRYLGILRQNHLNVAKTLGVKPNPITDIDLVHHIPWEEMQRQHENHLARRRAARARRRARKLAEAAMIEKSVEIQTA